MSFLSRKADEGFDRLQTLLETLDVHRRVERAVDILTTLVEITHEEAAHAVAQRWGTLDKTN